MDMEDDGFVVRLRGLPWSATIEDVFNFFEGCEINGGENGIHLTLSREGRPSGEAFVEFASEEDVQQALKKNKEHLGQRYIEVFRSKKGEMDWVIKRAGMDSNNMSEAVVRLRGLPFGCSKEEIAQFFTGFEIVPNGIMLPEDRLGRSTGEAFVQFASQEIAEKALGKHKDRIGHRYIEIFKSSMAQANAVFGNQRGGMRPPMGMGGMMGRPCPYDRNDRFGGPMGPGMMPGPMGPFGRGGRGGRNLKGYYDDDDFDDYNMGYGNMSFMGNRGRGGMRPPRGGMRGGMMMDDRPRGPPGSHYISKTGHSVHMRGMPFLAIEQDVFDFFKPMQPVRVEFDYGPDGRRTGEANVDFATHQEALEAMKKHRANMQHRYIELFLNSTPSPRGGSDGGGYGGDIGGNNTGGGYGMGGGGGGGYGGPSNNFGSGPGQQFNNNASSGGGGYGMGGNMGGSMGGGGGYGGMNNSYMDGGYNNMGSNSMGSMGNPNYTAF
ncbi:hypothetical protein BaRGS_00006306 [Batillaria attramentaria]|uniref:RRM domain-containing protein n=1 Tax=Batillaria attramentaria TaxID=370345 RepID=A0ABD0LTA3_9CAEN